MQESLNCWLAIELYEEYIRAIHPDSKAKRIINELRCATLRFWVSELCVTRTTSGRKMTKHEVDSAKQFLQTLGVEVLLKAHQTLQKAFETQKASIATRNTYGSRFQQFLSWSEQQEWWPDPRSRKARIKAQCCPVLKNPYGEVKSTALNRAEDAISEIYSSNKKDTPAVLQKELDEFYRFLTEPEWPLRVIDPIGESSASEHLKNIRLMLGWFCRHRTPPIALSQLRLSHLFPVVTQEDLEHLSSREQAKVWKQHKQTLETWLCSYFRFLREVLHSKSPQTKRNKLAALLALGKFLYTAEVEEEADYALLPLFKVINNHLDTVRKDISEWTRNRRSVSDFEKKWPDTAEGETALSVVRSLSCRTPAY
jgi:hypothetical protein